MRKFQDTRGFTLIEVMIVIAIIAILAAVALPEYMRFQTKSKQLEGRLLVSTLKTGLIAYYGSEDIYTTDIWGLVTQTAVPNIKFYDSLNIFITAGYETQGFVVYVEGNIDNDVTRDGQAWKKDNPGPGYAAYPQGFIMVVNDVVY